MPGFLSWYKYVPQEGLEHLKSYKYSCTDLSIMTNYVMQPIWSKMIHFMPTVLAPNLVTLMGFCFILASFGVTVWDAPKLVEPLPSWVYLFNAVCVFLYQTFDALDGTSSPLGELFDHGCDAMTTFFLGVTAMAALRTGDSLHSFVTLWVSMTMFFLSQWDVYFSGQLFLGPFNVTETQFFIMVLQLACFFAGPDFWLRTFVVPGFGWVVYYRTPILVLAYAMAAMNVFDFCKNVWHSVHGKNAWGLPVPEMRKRALLYAFPGLFSAFWTAAWVAVEPALLREYNVVYAVGFGFVFANLVGRIVTYRVCHVKFHAWYWVMLPLPFLVAHSYFQLRLLSLGQLVWGFALFSALAYLHFGLSLIDEMTEYLNIRALVIPFPNPATKDDMWAKVFAPDAVKKSLEMAEAAAKKSS